MFVEIQFPGPHFGPAGSHSGSVGAYRDLLGLHVGQSCMYFGPGPVKAVPVAGVKVGTVYLGGADPR